MIYYPLSALINFLGSLLLGLFVLSRNRKDPLNITFTLFALSTAFWSFSYFLWQIVSDKASALFWSRSLMAGAIFIPVFFFHFILTFLRIYHEKKKILFVSYFLATFFLLSNFTPLFVKDIAPRLNFNYWPIPGIFFHPYLVMFIILVVYSHWLMFIAMKSSTSGIFKNQIRYVFLGTLIGYLGGSTNFLLWYNIPMPPWGNALVISYVAFTTYAIVRHRLMSIEIVIQRGVVYGLISMAILVLYAAAVYLSETVFRQVLGYSYWLVTSVAVLILAIAYHPLVRWLQWLTDQLFFKERYTYQQTLRKLSQKISSVINLEELTHLIVTSFLDAMKVSEISFLLLDQWKEHFHSVELSGISRYKIMEIDVGHPIIKWLSENKDILVKDELANQILQLEPGKERRALEKIQDTVENLGIDIWLPIISKEELVGIIALGGKLSGEIFSSEDLALFGVLASQTALGLENARLYSEILGAKDYSQEILQSMVNGVLTVDRRGRVVTFNYTAEKITGRKGEEVIGKTAEEVWGKRGVITSAMAKTLSANLVANLETSLVSPERGLVPVSISSTLLHDASGKKIGALLSITDLSEIRGLEDKVRRADKLEALATMAAGMAHEIKNPLSSLKVFSQLLSSKYDDSSYRRKFLEIVPAEINRIDRIVESLLGFAKATSPNFEKIKIEALLEEVLKDYLEQAKNSQVKIEKDFSLLPEIELDPSQIRQVFSNLILNALQAMPEGGTLAIRTYEGKKIEDLLQEIKIEVKDSGHGISADMQEKLFDPFFTTKHGGTGLGLTIAHSLIDGHKGSIDVKSEIGKGTSFIVTLPVKQKTLQENIQLKWR